jgi:hypothetical protein
MSATLEVPAELAPVVRKAVLQTFGFAAQAAGEAVDSTLDAEALETIRETRRLLQAHQETLAVVCPDLADLYVTEALSIPLVGDCADALGEAIRWALYEGDLDKQPPEEIVKIGRRFDGLIKLRDQLQLVDVAR